MRLGLSSRRFHRGQLDPELLRRWLFHVARNLCIDALRTRSRIRPVGTIEHRHPVSPDRANLDTGNAFLVALGQLTPRDRELIKRRFLSGDSYSDLAAELSLSVASVRVAVFRAKHLLLENLAGLGWPD
jgi:RNA polymerase sigma factor (sigma-70 family)